MLASLRPYLLSVTLFGALVQSQVMAQSASPSAGERTSAVEDVNQAGIRALMITGGCCHDYQNQKQIISEGLSERFPGIHWTILQYGTKKDIKADVYRDGDWIDGFDVVVHNECFGGVTDGEFVTGIVAAHRRTKIPAIVVHCSIHSYRNAPTADAWREFVGVTSRRHEKTKHSLSVVPTASGKDDKTLAVLAGEPWQTPNGELYLIEKVWPGTTVLATAHSSETEQDEPVIWKNEVDGIRVFGISLGHHNETMLDPKWQSVVNAGFAWALDR